jgi:hypothetical protein
VQYFLKQKAFSIKFLGIKNFPEIHGYLHFYGNGIGHWWPIFNIKLFLRNLLGHWHSWGRQRVLQLKPKPDSPPDL